MRPTCPRFDAGAARGRSAILIVLLALILAACGGSSGTPAAPASTNTASDTPTPIETTQAQTTAPAAEETATEASTPASQGTPGDVPPELLKMAESLAKAERYRMTIVGKDAETEELISEFVIEVVRPDKVRMKMSIDGSVTETIGIGDTTYIKVGDTWQVSPQPYLPGDLAAPDPEESLEQTIGQLTDPGTTVTLAGTETVDGVECNVWDVVMTSEQGTYESRFWVGKDDGLMRKAVANEDEDLVTETTVTYLGSDFDIEPPV